MSMAIDSRDDSVVANASGVFDDPPIPSSSNRRTPVRESWPNTTDPALEPAENSNVAELAAHQRGISNPVNGERIVVQTSGAETDGRLLVFDLFLPPGGHVPAKHVHPLQTEHFTVIAGRMRFRLGGKTVLAVAGDTVTVLPRMEHWFGNDGDCEAHARVEVRPALRMEELLEATETLRRTRRVLGFQMPHISDIALFMLEFRHEVAVPRVPARLVWAVLAPIAWLRHYRAGRKTA